MLASTVHGTLLSWIHANRIASRLTSVKVTVASCENGTIFNGSRCYSLVRRSCLHLFVIKEPRLFHVYDIHNLTLIDFDISSVGFKVESREFAFVTSATLTVTSTSRIYFAFLKITLVMHVIRALIYLHTER